MASKENVISNILSIGWPMTFPKIGFFVMFAKKAWEKFFDYKELSNSIYGRGGYTLFENESITDINYPELLTPVYQYTI